MVKSFWHTLYLTCTGSVYDSCNHPASPVHAFINGSSESDVPGLLQCDAVWCSVLQCVAVCRSVLQCVVVCYRMWRARSASCQLYRTSEWDTPHVYEGFAPQLCIWHVLQRVAACCSVLQRVAACCSELQWVAACFNCCDLLQCAAVCCSVTVCDTNMNTKNRAYRESQHKYEYHLCCSLSKCCTVIVVPCSVLQLVMKIWRRHCMRHCAKIKVYLYVNIYVYTDIYIYVYVYIDVRKNTYIWM